MTKNELIEELNKFPDNYTILINKHWNIDKVEDMGKCCLNLESEDIKDLIKDYEERLDFYKNKDIEPDCLTCKHHNLGEDKRDTTCHDCKWNYNSCYEKKYLTDCDRCLNTFCSYEPHSIECQSARCFEGGGNRWIII